MRASTKYRAWWIKDWSVPRKVYLATDKYPGRTIAAKEIDKSLLEEAKLDDYFAEAKLMAAAQYATNVVPIHYACDLGDRIGLAMPYYQNGSLQNVIDDGPVGIVDLIRIGVSARPSSG